MTPDEMPACESCGARYVSRLAAALCCEDRYDEPEFERGYD